MLKLRPKKIKAYLDDRISSNKLTWLEKMNIMCDLRAKELIRNESRQVVPFPFELVSLFVSSSFTPNTINSKEDLILYILLAQAKEYLKKKLHSLFPLL